MQMADHYSPQWALKETTYFDHETHRFRVGDLEIEGGRIHAVKPPGTSTFEQAVPAREWVCTPGLVNVLAGAPLIDGAPERLLSAGMTTAGTLYATARECIVAATRTRLRLVTRLILNPFARARSQQRQPDAEARAPEIHALERLNALVRCNGGRFRLRCIARRSSRRTSSSMPRTLRRRCGSTSVSCCPTMRDPRARFVSAFIAAKHICSVICSCSGLARRSWGSRS